MRSRRRFVKQAPAAVPAEVGGDGIPAPEVEPSSSLVDEELAREVSRLLAESEDEAS